ncbi:hypothetical protein CMEL01_14751 [Colletotrichum melonis]|uniref:Uncharacterized protein n=1 Tax=Colletotrichum melonis TaxID=1209925 RepID=A0AAI9XUK8_9PEZI|nr:hypothetical protein CMEL01_14751 [Colletotrichum melonis]
MIKQYFAEVHLLTKDVYIWWFRHNIWVIIPGDSRMGYAMTVHTDLVRECAKMSRVSCQILNGRDRDRESWWTGHTIDYMAARVRRLEPDNWRKLYLSWEWRQKIADMWYRSPRKDWMKK